MIIFSDQINNNIITLSIVFIVVAEMEDDNKIFLNACEHGDFRTVLNFINAEKTDQNIKYDEGFQMACDKGHCHVVGLLLLDDRVNPGAGENAALISACGKSHYGVVCQILDSGKVDPTKPKHAPLKAAIKAGSIIVIRKLLQNNAVDKYVRRKNFAMRVACKCGHDRIVEMLLREYNGNMLEMNDFNCYIAFKRGHFSTGRLLLKYSDACVIDNILMDACKANHGVVIDIVLSTLDMGITKLDELAKKCLENGFDEMALRLVTCHNASASRLLDYAGENEFKGMCNVLKDFIFLRFSKTETAHDTHADVQPESVVFQNNVVGCNMLDIISEETMNSPNTHGHTSHR